MKTRREFTQDVGAGLMGGVLTRVLPWAVGGSALLWPWRVEAAILLNPQDPSNFTQEGTQSFTPGTVLTLTDGSVSDFIAFFAPDGDASPGVAVDVVATFQVLSTAPVNADAGNRVVINDGQTRSAIAACIIKNGINGIGLLSQGSPTDPASYPVFVAVDWQAAPVTVRLRRTATGDAELVEVNGVAPSPRALLTFDKAPGVTRTFPSFEFGCASVEAKCTVAYSAFRSELVVNPVAGKLSVTHLRLRDSDSVDRIQIRADYTLGTGSNGINPAVEPVTIKLSTPAGGQFYPSPDFNPLNGFDVQGNVGKRRWKLNDAERLRTGIEQCHFDEDPNNSGGFFLRDFRTNLVDADFSTVNVEITVGTGAAEDKLTGTANLVERPFGSGKWRLDR
jgi:hypothetical protein